MYITCILHVFLQGADTDLKCHWTDMNAIHYAVFFDCDDVVDRLCEHNPGTSIMESIIILGIIYCINK